MCHLEGASQVNLSPCATPLRGNPTSQQLEISSSEGSARTPQHTARHTLPTLTAGSCRKFASFAGQIYSVGNELGGE